MRILVNIVILAGILAALLSPASAQTLRATIAGVVSDSQNRPIPDAMVQLQHSATGRSWQTSSGSSGEFLLAMLPPGEFSINISKKEFQTFARALTLLTNQEIRVDATLPAGQVTERIVVTARRSVLKADSAAMNSVLENHLVRGLPLDGRNFLELSLLLPGVLPAAQGSAASLRGEPALNVNGAREDSNNYLLDGIYNGDPKLNNAAYTPGVDAIQEFEVLANNYDASFGRNAGGQVNMVLKSGSNDWHGASYYFLRNAGLDARNFFAAPAEPDPRYQRHQYGASFGGPLIQNRTFFFADYEGLRLREGDTQVTNVPTEMERAGDFSQSAQQPYDPVSGQPFPGAVIPGFYQHPTGSSIATLYPLPNRETPWQNYVASPAIRNRTDQFDARLDQAVGANGDLTFRYSFVDGDVFNPFSGPTFAKVPGYGTSVPRRAQNGMVSETHTFSPTWINEVRLGFNRVASRALHENFGTSLNSQVGLPELSGNSRDFGLSLITLPGYSTIGDESNNPQNSVTNSYQALDQVTHAHGSHLLKFGFDFRYTQQNAFRDVQSRGFLNFLGVTGNPLSDLLLGYPTVTGGAKLDNPQYLRTRSYNFFANDDWRVAPNVTVTLGLRYEFNSPPADKFDRANVYVAELGQLVPVGTDGIPRSGYQSDKNNWAPRAGVAWRPGGGSTVIRSGYGIYHDLSSLAPGEGLYFSPPYFDFRLFYTLQGAPLTLNDPFPFESFPFPSPPSALSFQRDLRSPYVQQWNLSIQQKVGRNRVLEVAYVGSKGTKQLSARDINQPAPSTLSPYLRPNPMFSDVNQLESRSSSSYHSLQARVQQYLTGGLSFLASYTYGKSIDDASSFFSSAGDSNFPQNSYDLRSERGRSNYDIGHRMALSYSWELPFGRGKRWLNQTGLVRAMLGNWQTFGIWSFQTGRPFTVALLSDLDNSNTGRSSLGFGANDRPNVVGDPKLDGLTPERWFNTDAFAMPPFGSFGNSGRNILDGPGLQNINVSLLRDFPITEGTALQFRAEVFNLLNRTNFGLPDIFLGSPSFGSIQSAGSPRRIQFGVKLLF